MNTQKTSDTKLSVRLDIEYCEGIACFGVPIPQEKTIHVTTELTPEECAQIRMNLAQNPSKKEEGIMPMLREKLPDLYQKIDEVARTAICHDLLVRDASTGDLMLDEEEQIAHFKEECISGDFHPEDALEESIFFDEVPESEEELFYLWQEYERRRIAQKGFDWLLGRYTLSEEDLIPDHYSYFCEAPDLRTPILSK